MIARLGTKSTGQGHETTFAQIIATEPGAMTLRYLQTLTEIAGEKNSTILFPIPIDLINLFQSKPSAGPDGEPRSD